MHTAAAPATYRVQRTPGQRGLGRSRSGDSSGRRASGSTGTEGRDGSARARSPNRQDPRLEQVREQRHACCCVALVYSELRAACGHCRVCGWCVRPLVRVYCSPFLTISPRKTDTRSLSRRRRSSRWPRCTSPAPRTPHAATRAALGRLRRRGTATLCGAAPPPTCSAGTCPSLIQICSHGQR